MKAPDIKMHIQLSPIEKMKINYDLKKITIKKQNLYKPDSYTFNVDNKYKPGFRHMYFDFIESCVFKKRQALFGTSIDDLIDIYIKFVKKKKMIRKYYGKKYNIYSSQNWLDQSTK